MSPVSAIDSSEIYLNDSSIKDLPVWDGANCEALRRWAALPLERIISALEEMQEPDDKLRSSDVAGAIKEQQAGYDSGTEKDRS